MLADTDGCASRPWSTERACNKGTRNSLDLHVHVSAVTEYDHLRTTSCRLDDDVCVMYVHTCAKNQLNELTRVGTP
jgi:hypothetical protein